MNVCAIILAAGKSRRMGTQKLLLPFGGKTMIGHIVDEVLAAGVRTTVVVVAKDSPDVTAALAGKPVVLVENPQIEGDMLSSVRTGLESAPDDCGAILVMLGDQPTIRTSLLRQMMQVMDTSGRRIVVPVHGGRRGHPVLFSRQYRDEVMNRFDKVGLRGLAEAHVGDVEELGAGESVLEDVDFPEDYQRALNAMSGGMRGANTEERARRV